MKNINDLKEEVDFHLGIITRLAGKTNRGTFVNATFRRSRYPHIYPRDVAMISKLLYTLCAKKLRKQKSYNLLKGIAKFIISIQSRKGCWYQRYSQTGRDRSIYKQEDNTAMGAIIIANYVLASYKLKKKPEFELKAIKAIIKGLDYALENHYNKDMELFYSTTAIHESSLEEGFTIWTNFSYWFAFKAALEICKFSKYSKKLEKYDGFFRQFDKTVKARFVADERFIARLDTVGKPDMRADITLFTPFYYGFKPKKTLENTAAFVHKELWDPELGLYQRYPFIENDMTSHYHAGNGPWIQYSAIIARYYYSVEEYSKADKIMKLIDGYKTSMGYLPEHISTVERFRDFIKKEWKTGKDFDKEFMALILQPQVDFDKIFEELSIMKRVYDKIKMNLRRRNTPLIRFGIPLAWSHSEYLLTQIVRASKKGII